MLHLIESGPWPPAPQPAQSTPPYPVAQVHEKGSSGSAHDPMHRRPGHEVEPRRSCTERHDQREDAKAQVLRHARITRQVAAMTFGRLGARRRVYALDGPDANLARSVFPGESRAGLSRTLLEQWLFVPDEHGVVRRVSLRARLHGFPPRLGVRWERSSVVSIVTPDRSRADAAQERVPASRQGVFPRTCSLPKRGGHWRQDEGGDERRRERGVGRLATPETASGRACGVGAAHSGC